MSRSYTIQLTQKELDIIRVSLDGSDAYYDEALEGAIDAGEAEYFKDSLQTTRALIRRLEEMEEQQQYSQ